MEVMCVDSEGHIDLETCPSLTPEKILVTSECLSCKLPYTREEYSGMPWGALALTVCDNCHNGEILTIQLAERYVRPQTSDCERGCQETTDLSKRDGELAEGSG